MKTYRLNYVLLMLICYSSTVLAQTKKIDKSYKTNPDIVVEIDASHTNIQVEKWDKNEVAIEAFINGEQLPAENVQQLLDNWKLNVKGNAEKLSITSHGKMQFPAVMALDSLQIPMLELPEMMEPLMEMVEPILKNITENPIPPQLLEHVGDISFDYEAYQENGEKYMEKWEKEIEKNFGEDYEKAMEEWAKNFEKDTVWQKELELKMEDWGEKFGANMEEWGKEFEKKMESWAAQFEENVEDQYKGKDTIIILNNLSGSKRTLKITIPENATLNLNVRHGKVNLEGTTANMQARLSHSQFLANTISGKKTNIEALYTPLKVKSWNYGILTTGYVKEAKIDHVKSLKLISNASDMAIGNIEEIAVISGTFGELDIQSVAPGFKMLDISLENSDLTLNLPESAFNFNYSGSQSTIELPESIKTTSTENYGNKIINGYQKTKNSVSGMVTINSRFSNVKIR